MLNRLIIRNIVLVDRLEVSFGPGMCCLTGETGSGKSVLLDALGLALGNRAEQRLLRAGAEQGSVIAEFDISANSPCKAVLDHYALPVDPILLVRRVLYADGKSRAFIGDVPVGQSTLRDVGDTLLEVHGQHAQRGLLDSKTHRIILDRFGRLEALAAEVRTAHHAWSEARSTFKALTDAQARLRQEEEYLRHVLDELHALAPEEAEEQTLAEQRRIMMQGEKLADILNSAIQELGYPNSVAESLAKTERLLLRAGEDFAAVNAVVDQLTVAAEQVQEAESALEQLLREGSYDPQELERAEERLFALRAAARKHQCSVDELPGKYKALQQQMQQLEHGEEALEDARKRCDETRAVYLGAARRLTVGRQEASSRLVTRMHKELPPLKMEKATFTVEMVPLNDEDGTADGLERVAFHIATNPGTAPGPLAKIASGGELSRFMLALKVALAEVGGVPSMVFDEVDTGVGGAVAESIGKRLAMLAGGDAAKQRTQVFVVTHQPQVAAQAARHYRVWKKGNGNQVITRIELLSDEERQEELARMLAGKDITQEARAAASSLLELAS